MHEDQNRDVVLLDRSDSAEMVAESDSPDAYAAAWGQAFRQLLERLTVELRTTISASN